MKKIIPKNKIRAWNAIRFVFVVRLFKRIALCFILMHFSMEGWAQEVQFIQENELTLNSGHVRLDWVSENDGNFVLQQATDEDFKDARTIYEGPDKASFISGLKNGTYYFRIKLKQGNWSDQVQAVVQYQSLTLAFSLFTVGAIVFILTTVVIVKGSYTYKNTNA